jgi:phage terminase large subunit-like protein
MGVAEAEKPARTKRKKAPARPFTLTHFRIWARTFELDNGQPFKLEPFQELFIKDVFSGKPVCWLVIPQGNGKTTLVSLLALYHIEFTDFGSVMVSAATREQATTIAQQAHAMLIRSERENEFVCQVEGNRRIRYDPMHSRMQVKAADEKTGDGIIPTLCIIDELHRQKDLGLYRTWRGKLKKRNAQMIVISTAGEPGSQFEEQRERMRQMAQEVERGETFTRAIGDSFVLHDWSVAEDGDSDDLELVARANPLSAVTVATLRAERESPDWNHQHWRRLTCNLPTRSEMAAITESEWFEAVCEEPIPIGEPIWLGLDVAWKWDTTAAVPLWWRDEEFRLLGPASVLVPPRDGNSLDPALVERALVEIHHRNPIHTVVMDMSRAEQLASWIESEFGATVVDRAQTNKFAAMDYEKFMDALRQGWLKHSGDRDLTSHALNAIARILPYGDARFERPAQSRAAREQDRRVIDALTAASMVHSAAALQPSGDFLLDVEDLAAA